MSKALGTILSAHPLIKKGGRKGEEGREKRGKEVEEEGGRERREMKNKTEEIGRGQNI